MGLKVLAISGGHDGSVALVIDQKLVAYIATERITRYKKDRGVTKRAIKYLLDKEGLRLKDIDLVGVCNWYWDKNKEGVELWDKEEEGFSIVTDNGVEYSLNDYMDFHQNPGMVAQGFYQLNIGDQAAPCMLIDHHFAHCATGFYLSPFEEALCVSIDFNDNMGSNHSVYYFNDKEKTFRPFRRGGDFLIGSFYGQICDYLGFYPSLTDAGKVMALAAYEQENLDAKIIEDLSWPHVVRMGDIFHGDQYTHLLTRMGIKKIPENTVYFPQLPGEGGKADKSWLNKKDWNKKLNKKIAAYAQAILETSTNNFVGALVEETSAMTKNICMAGGTILNCVANGKVLNNYKKHNLFIPPAPGDDGLTIGTALFLSNYLSKNRKGQIQQNSDKKKVSHTTKECFEGGKIYDEEIITDAINAKDYEEKTVIQKPKTQNGLVEKVVEYIKAGKIIGWFNGGSEIGPRALGHRSIIADPRNPEMKDILNDKVKHRESFRPFAPLVLEEFANEWFNIEVASPFMLFSVECKKPEMVPAAVHIDNTARLQTVNKEDNDITYDLLKAWHKETECPVLLNTSFNVMGEPIVETPTDALKCFFETEIDVLVMGDYIITKAGK